MDDVWGNAWSQPEDDVDVAHHVPTRTKLDGLPSWSRASTSGKHDEADVGTPSWSTGELNWTEPTGQASLWSSSGADDDVHLDAWATPAHSPTVSTTDQDNSVVEDSASSRNTVEPPAVEEITRSSTPQSAETEQPAQASMADVDLIDPVLPKAHTSTPASPDGFGSFAQEVFAVPAGGVTGSDTWSSPELDEGANSWGSAWATAVKSPEASVPVKDEWAIAQEAKARRDRTVPPELLQSILGSLQKVTDEMWTLKHDEFFKNDLGNWRNGMENFDSLDDLRSKFVPDSPMQPPIKYAETRIAKELNQSIKLSKNLPVVRNSPMSHLFTTKSLAAWELSVKSKEYVERDETPAGWKLPNIEEKEAPRPSLSEKKSGGILSFFNKRNSTPSPTPSASAARRTSVSREPPDSSSAKASVEKSISVPKSSEAGPSTLKSSPLASPSTSPFVQTGTPAVAVSALEKEATSDLETPTPSALSKFFNRFSRTKSNGKSSSPSPRNSISMALSSEEMDFLSDIVPSHAEDASEMDSLNALTSFVSSPPIPEKLPPALAPPPSLPLPPLRAPSLASRTGASHSRSKSQLPLMEDSAPLTQSQRVIDLISDLPILAPSQPSTSTESSSSISPRDRQRNGAFNFDVLQPSVTLVPSSRATSTKPDLDLSLGLTLPKQLLRHVGSDPIPLTPIEKSLEHTRLQPPQTMFDDDDEFSDFQGHVTSNDSIAVSAASDNLTSLGQPPHPVASVHKVDENFFGDFSEFVCKPSSSSFARTPTSPVSPDAGIPPPLPKKQVPANLNTLHARKPSASAHDSAARLVEAAALKQGRWPAPPSPLPPALSPPPLSGGSAASRPLYPAERARSPSNDPRLASSRSQSIPLKSIAQITASSSSRPSSPVPVASPPRVVSQVHMPDAGPTVDLDPLFNSTAPAQTVPPAKPFMPPLTISKESGKGLSAQDLSFFEGL